MLASRLALQSKFPFIALRYAYRGRKRMLEALGPDLAQTVSMRVDDAPLGDTQIERLFESTDQVHKWRHYFRIYEDVLAGTERMLEIGVDRGGSLEMWREYLPAATIVGVDIDPRATQYEDIERNVHVRIGDQTDVSFLKRVLDEFGPFDTILDDGGHTNRQMIVSFQYLFPRLKPGGVYIVEDVHANYWTSYRDQPESFIDFTKWLMDAMHAPYIGRPSIWPFMEGHRKELKELDVPLATTIVEKIEAHDSVLVIHRAEKPKPLPRNIRR